MDDVELRGMTLKHIRIARLKQLSKERSAAGPAQLGEIIGRKTNQVSDLLHGRASFGEKVARSIEHHAGLPPGWLDDDEGGHVARKTAPATPPAQASGEAVNVPLLAISGSMGPGVEMAHEEVVTGSLSLSLQWAAKTLPQVSAPENLRFIHGYGDSMSPTFSDGDVLLVDSGVHSIEVDGIYVLSANQRLYIKRVRQRLDGRFEISSDNATVKTVDVLDGKSTVDVLGRIVWAWNGRRL